MWPWAQINGNWLKHLPKLIVLDAKELDGSLQEFLSGEIRYATLEASFPEESKRLRVKIENEFMERYQSLKRLVIPKSNG